jgi:hypothetical protein
MGMDNTNGTPRSRDSMIADAAKRSKEPSQTLFGYIKQIAGEKIGAARTAIGRGLNRIFSTEGGVALLGFGVQAVALAAIYTAVQHLRKR